MLRVPGKNIDLREIEPADAAFVLSLRLDPELNQYLHPTDPSLQKQIDWIKNYQKRLNESYFIVENKRQQAVGTIRLYEIHGQDFAWGSWIITKAARHYASLESLVLLYQHAFLTLNLEKANFFVRKDNNHVFQFYLRFGANIVNEDQINYYFTYTKEDYLASRAKHLDYINLIGVPK